MATPAPAHFRRPTRTRPRFWLRRLILVVLLLLPVALWQGYVQFTKSLSVPPEAAAPPVVPTQPVHVVVMGVDERENDIGRADTLMLVRLDPALEQSVVVNIPRDTRVRLPAGDLVKVNSVYGLEGVDMVTRVLGELLNVPKPYYVKVDLESFEKIVDQVGGVTLTVDRDYVYEDPFQDLYINIKAGEQHMNGETALKFVRIRYDGVTNDDIARIARQQQFLDAMRKKLSSPSYWLRIPGLVGIVRKYVATNIPERDQLRLAELLYKSRNSVDMLTLPGYPDDENGDWLLDSQEWAAVKQKWSVQ